MSLNLAIVHANIVVYSCAYWLCQNAMPLLLKSLGATSLSFGYFQSLFNLVQLVGGLTIGNLQDRFSTKAAMTLTQVGSTVVYACVSASTSLNGMYLSRLPTTLQQSMQVAQGFVAKNTPEGPERTVALSRLSLSYGAGMIVAGALNMLVFSSLPPGMGVATSLLMSAAIVGANIIFFNPDSSKKVAVEKQPPTTATAVATTTKKPASSVAYWRLISDRPATYLFLGTLYTARSIFESVLQLTLINVFKLELAGISNITTASAVIGMTSTVVGTPIALRYLGSEKIYTKVSMLFLLVAHLAILLAVGSTTDGVPADYATTVVFLTGIALMAFFSSALYTLNASQITAGVNTADHAQAVATTHALRSLVGIVAPLIGTGVYTWAGEGKAVGAMSTFAFSVVLLLCSYGLFVQTSSASSSSPSEDVARESKTQR